MVLNFITLAQPLCLCEVSVKLSPPPVKIYKSASIESLARSAKREQRYSNSSPNFTQASCSYIRPVLRCRQATGHYPPRKLFTTISSSMPIHRIHSFETRQSPISPLLTPKSYASAHHTDPTPLGRRQGYRYVRIRSCYAKNPAKFGLRPCLLVAKK